jgi:hypothetical protein
LATFFPETKKSMTYEKTAPTIPTFWRKPHEKIMNRSKVIAKKSILSYPVAGRLAYLKRSGASQKRRSELVLVLN